VLSNALSFAMAQHFLLVLQEFVDGPRVAISQILIILPKAMYQFRIKMVDDEDSELTRP
jgi:hypothetical protein